MPRALSKQPGLQSFFNPWRCREISFLGDWVVVGLVFGSFLFALFILGVSSQNSLGWLRASWTLDLTGTFDG